MTNTTRDDLDRATSGRFVRNLALSLSGGALLTLIGATAAHADDAATASEGAGAATSLWAIAAVETEASMIANARVAVWMREIIFTPCSVANFTMFHL